MGRRSLTAAHRTQRKLFSKLGQSIMKRVGKKRKHALPDLSRGGVDRLVTLYTQTHKNRRVKYNPTPKAGLQGPKCSVPWHTRPPPEAGLAAFENIPRL